MNSQRISRHFLPHFFVEREFAINLREPHRGHHRAHALSLFSLIAYLYVLTFLGAGFWVVKLKAPQILATATFSAEQIINLTNQKRAQSGLGNLVYNPILTRAAGAKAQDMFANNYWAHNSPSGKTPWSFITAAGYRYVFAGENLARDFGDAGAVVDAWMASPSHRSNLLDKNFKETGVAVANGKLTGREGTLVVQMFGTRVSPVAGESTKTKETKEANLQEAPQSKPESSPLAQIAEEETSGLADAGSSAVLASRRFSIAKGASLTLVGFIFVLFALEIIVTLRRAHAVLRPGVIAHLALLGFMLFALWYAAGGAIL